MSKLQKLYYRIWLCIALLFVLATLVFVIYRRLEMQIPDEILLYRDQVEKLDFSLPFGQASVRQQEGEELLPVSVNNSEPADQSEIHFSMGEPVTIKAEKAGSFRAQVKLFGWLNYKYITFDVMEEARVLPVGQAVGLYVRAQGLMVLGTGRIEGKDGFEYQPSREILRSGDYILAFNGEKLESIDQLSESIQENGTKRAVFTIKRGKNKIKVRISPVLSQEGSYQIGAWLREDTEGIGTLTFVNEKGQFAALGHGITDADTGVLIRIQDGGLYPAQVEEIVRGEIGSPGELVGSVRLGQENCLGKITNNTDLGITGNITSEECSYQEENSLPVGRKQEVKKGEATIRCQLGEEIREYQIEIEKIDFSSQDNKGMEIHVTDKELLKEAGGIVQGMSGAPIIQDGKCIGAVTHVFVQDVTRGYGTFIENML